MTQLTEAHVQKLRQPFTDLAVKWRADQKEPDYAGNVRCLIYIDARLARERLSDVDPSWTSTIRPSVMDPSTPECFLTVHGVTRSDVGASAMKGQNRVKALYSDAEKRAAVAFHVGAYLYAMPVFKVGKGGYWTKGKGSDGEVGGLTSEGVKDLRKQYSRVVNHAKFQERFGAPVDYGDVEDDERSVTPEGEGDEQLAFGSVPAAGRPVKRGAA